MIRISVETDAEEQSVRDALLTGALSDFDQPFTVVRLGGGGHGDAIGGGYGQSASIVTAGRTGFESIGGGGGGFSVPGGEGGENVYGSRIGRGGRGTDPSIPECPACGAYGGGGHGGNCPNVTRRPEDWVSS